MPGRAIPRLYSTLLALALLAAPALAQESPSNAAAASDEKIARLEALLQAQQQQIQSLEQQVSTTQSQDQDAARVEAMRQQIREILSEQEFRESLMPATLQAGYDAGFFIRSTDDNFLLRTNGLFQMRWTHYATRSDNRYLNRRLERDDRTGFDLNRMRLQFSGHAYTKDLTYLVNLASDSPGGYDTGIAVAFLDYRFADEFHFRGGVLRLQSTRAQAVTHDRLQMVERPLMDAVFGLGYAPGVEFWGWLFNKRLEYHLQVVNSFSDGENGSNGRTITTDPAELDSNPGIIFRTVWHALGESPETDFLSPADHDISTTPKLDFGFHYAFNDDQRDLRTTRIPFPVTRRALAWGRDGGFGLTNTNGLQINQFGFDTNFKYLGFSATGEYVLRMVDPRRAGRAPFTPWWSLTGDDSTTVQHGAYVQVGYFLPIPGLEKKVELAARVGGVSALAERQEGTWEYAGGVNYYIKGDMVKLQTDVVKVSEVPISAPYHSLANVNDDALVFRVQLQVAF